MYEQRVVYAGLSRMTEDRNIVKAGYQHWQETLASQPLDVFEVVADLTTFLGLGSTERKKLMVSMHSAAGRLADELPPVPEYIKSDQGSTAPATQQQPEVPRQVKKVSPHKAVTERYLQLVCQYVKRHDASAFNELAVIISDEGLPKLGSDLKRVVSDWASSGLGKIEFADSVSIDQCESTALEFYVLMSEVIGPVDSDVIVNKAIVDLQSFEASQQFSPSNLL